MRADYEHQLIQKAVVIAERAGELVWDAFDSPAGRYRAGPYDIKIEIDRTSESFLVSALRGLTPGCTIFSEEEVAEPIAENGITWVVDPLDGTNNFASGIPYLAVGISLLVNGNLRGAVLHDPITKSTLAASIGSGLRQGSALFPINVPTPEDLVGASSATVSLVTDYSRSGRLTGYELNRKLGERVRRVISLWAPGADLMRICLRQIDALVCISADFRDVGAGLLLAQESGAHIFRLAGEPLRSEDIDPRNPVSFIVAADAATGMELSSIVQ